MRFGCGHVSKGLIRHRAKGFAWQGLIRHRARDFAWRISLCLCGFSMRLDGRRAVRHRNLHPRRGSRVDPRHSDSALVPVALSVCVRGAIHGNVGDMVSRPHRRPHRTAALSSAHLAPGAQYRRTPCSVSCWIRLSSLLCTSWTAAAMHENEETCRRHKQHVEPPLRLM